MHVSLSFTNQIFCPIFHFFTQLPLNRAVNLKSIHLKLGFDWVVIYWFKKTGFDQDRFRLYLTDPPGFLAL